MHLLWDWTPLKIPCKFRCPYIESPELSVYKLGIIKARECSDEHSKDFAEQLACEFGNMLELLQGIFALLNELLFVKVFIQGGPGYDWEVLEV